jgi:hypothetical protein
MKKKLTAIFLLLSMAASAQFPEPMNFEFESDYIMLYETGYCAGQWVEGPTYCSHFNWETPDTSTISSTLEYYNIYYYQYPTNDTTVIASVPETYFNVELGVMGEVWVTAVYSDPDGESGQSNTIVNEELPISVNENESMKKNKILYDRESQRISINNDQEINKIKVIDSQGKLVKSLGVANGSVNIKRLPEGFYIVEIVTDSGELIRQKIVK